MRVVRINELLKREISSILHTRYRDSSVRITISEVDTAPDMKAANVFYGVIGDETDTAQARHFFAKEGKEIREILGRHVIIKYLPHLKFQLDVGMERGAHMNELIDSLGIEDDSPKEAE